MRGPKPEALTLDELSRHAPPLPMSSPDASLRIQTAVRYLGSLESPTHVVTDVHQEPAIPDPGEKPHPGFRQLT